MPVLLGAIVLACTILRADPGDVESSHDYVGFPRMPGFVISDFDEDNPADFAYPIAQPLPDDADHVVTFPAKGHRYVIRYELAPGNRAPTVFQTQQYYEKLASDGGFTVEKNGAVGDVTETFYKTTAAHQIWLHLDPDVTVNVLTIVESTDSALPLPPPRLVVNTAALPPPPALTPPPEPKVVPPPAPAPAPDASSLPSEAPPMLEPPSDSAPAETASKPPADDATGEELFADLSTKGRIVVPFVFQPGKQDLDVSSQPLIDRVAAMMKTHPELFLRIEGHTDNSGFPEDNMRLSAQRAFAVQAKLVNADVSSKRLDAVGVGGLQPIASNSTATGREKNRRIELVLWKKSPAFHAPAPNGNNYYPGGTTGTQ